MMDQGVLLHDGMLLLESTANDSGGLLFKGKGRPNGRPNLERLHEVLHQRRRHFMVDIPETSGGRFVCGRGVAVLLDQATHMSCDSTKNASAWSVRIGVVSPRHNAINTVVIMYRKVCRECITACLVCTVRHHTLYSLKALLRSTPRRSRFHELFLLHTCTEYCAMPGN